MKGLHLWKAVLVVGLVVGMANVPWAAWEVIYTQDFEAGPSVMDEFSSWLNGNWEIVDDGTGNMILRQTATDTGDPAKLVWTGVPGANTMWADVQVTARMRIDEFAPGDGARAGLSTRAWNTGSPGPQIIGVSGLIHNTTGILETTFDGIGYGNASPVDFNPYEWFWMKIQIVGSRLKIKIWPEGTEEPSWWYIEQGGLSERSAGWGHIGFASQGNGTEYALASFDDLTVERYVDQIAWDIDAVYENDFSSDLGPEWQFNNNGVWQVSDGILSQIEPNSNNPYSAHNPVKAWAAGAGTPSPALIRCKIRVDEYVPGAQGGKDPARAGIAVVASNSANGTNGYNLLFHDMDNAAWKSDVQPLNEIKMWYGMYRMNWEVGQWYWMQMRIEDLTGFGQGTWIKCKVWADGTPEPESWMYSVDMSDVDQSPPMYYPALQAEGSSTSYMTASFDDLSIRTGSVGPVNTPTPAEPTATPTPAEGVCNPGDADRNCFVNTEDFRSVRDHFGANYGENCWQ